MSIATTTGGLAGLVTGGSPATRGRRRVVGLFSCAVVLAMICVLSLAIGTENVGLATAWRAVTEYTDTGNEWIVHELRIPRTILGIRLGARRELQAKIR